MSNNSSRDNSFDFSGIIGVVLFLVIVHEVDACRKRELVENIMNNEEYKQEHDIKTHEEAVEQAEYIMDLESERDEHSQ